MSISFDNIPVNMRTTGSYIEYNNTRAVQGTPAIPNVTMMFGTRLTAGTIAVDIPVNVTNKTVAETYFGHGSELAQMCEFYKDANPYTELWAIGIAESGGVVAAGTYTFTGTSTEAGSIFTYIGGERIVTSIPDGTAAAAASVLHEADITTYLLTSNMPVVESQATVVTTISALHKGTNGNTIDLAVNLNDGEAMPAGLTVAIAQMSSGTSTGDITNAIAALSDVWYTTIISSLSDDTNVDLLEAELLTRWGPLSQKDGHAFIADEGNQGALTSLGNARNSKHTTDMGSGLSPTPVWLWAAVVGAVDAGEPDPARPRQTLLLTGLRPPSSENQFTQAERAILLTDGISTYTINGGKCYIERLITTYQTNPLGTLDPSYLDVTTLRTLMFLRFSWRARVSLRFPRHKLAKDGTNFGPAQAIVTPGILKSEAVALFKEWETDGLVEDVDQFVKDIIVEINSSDPNRVDMRMSPNLMNQFRSLAGQIQFLI